MSSVMVEEKLSVVIPALKAEDLLPETLRALEEARALDLLEEVIVVAGGPQKSVEGLTPCPAAQPVALGRGIKVVQAGAASRGRQLAAGAEQAQGGWLLFLHADTQLSPGWARIVKSFLSEPLSERWAAYFRFQLDDPAPQARRIEALANWRARRLNLPYGDQGLLIHRNLYQILGGFRPIPLMEDVDIVRRIGAGRLVRLDVGAVTSAVRYRRGGWWGRPARNLCLLGLYFLGLPPTWLNRLYQ